MKKTTNYQLNQWEKTDGVLMNDFNADNAKIEAALSATPKIAIGTYTGSGTFGAENPNTLTFDFTPKLVVIVANCLKGTVGGAVLIQGQDKLAHYGWSSSGGGLCLNITWSDKTVNWYSSINHSDANEAARYQLNGGGEVYSYFAIG